MLSPNRRGRWVAGILLGLGTAPSAARGQEPPSALPPLPPLPAEPTGPVLRRVPPPVKVPPGADAPEWRPDPIDPVALERHRPKFVRAKARSWPWRRLQGKLWGYPEEFEPRPLGAAVYESGRIMAANGAAARMVLYHYDFVDGSPELNARGLDRLAEIAAQLAVSPYPLLVERTPADPALAEARRCLVLARLAGGPLPVPPERVAVGVPSAVGLSGANAQVISGNALGRTQQYGPPIPINSNGLNSPSGVTGSSPAAANGTTNP